MKHEGDGDTHCNWCTRNNSHRLVKELENLEISGREERKNSQGKSKRETIL